MCDYFKCFLSPANDDIVLSSSQAFPVYSFSNRGNQMMPDYARSVGDEQVHGSNCNP